MFLPAIHRAGGGRKIWHCRKTGRDDFFPAAASSITIEWPSRWRFKSSHARDFVGELK
jgi:hypothetical protein